MELIKEKWEDILYTVKAEHDLSEISFKTWLMPLTVDSIDEEKHIVTILVPSEQMGVDYINKKYMFPIKVAIAEITGTEYDIEFILPDQARALERKIGSSASSSHDIPSDVFERANLDPKYTYGITLISAIGWASGTFLGIVIGNILPGWAVNALGVSLYGMFLAVIIPPSKKSRFIAGLVIVSMVCSLVFTMAPVLGSISSGFRIIILTLLLASGAALLHPVEQDGQEQP